MISDVLSSSKTCILITKAVQFSVFQAIFNDFQMVYDVHSRPKTCFHERTGTRIRSNLTIFRRILGGFRLEFSYLCTLHINNITDFNKFDEFYSKVNDFQTNFTPFLHTISDTDYLSAFNEILGPQKIHQKHSKFNDF